MRPINHTMAGQNLAYRSTMELESVRQVPDGVAGEIGIHKPAPIPLAEVNLPLPRGR